MTGKIKTLKPNGFGFIKKDGAEGEKEIFFHKNALVGMQFEELQEGDTVSFEEEESQKGKNAVNVQRV